MTAKETITRWRSLPPEEKLRRRWEAIPLDEWLLLNMHRRICVDLVPEWAGRWREIEGTVGRLKLALPFQLPILMRDYGLDLQARWAGASRDMGGLISLKGG